MTNLETMAREYGDEQINQAFKCCEQCHIYASKVFVDQHALGIRAFLAGAQARQSEIDELVAALEFYAERNNWRSPNYDMETKSEITISDLGVKSFNGKNNFADFAIPSGGRRAREALKKHGSAKDE